MSGRRDDYDDYDDHHGGGDVVEDYSEYGGAGEVDDAGWGGGGGGGSHGGSQVQSNQSFEMADYSQRGFSAQSGASQDDGGGYSQAGQSYDDDGYGDGGYDDGGSGYGDGGYDDRGGQGEYDDGYDDHYDDRQPQGGGQQSGRSFDDGTYEDGYNDGGEYDDGGGGAQQSGRSFDDGTYETGYNDGGDEYNDGGEYDDGGGAERSGRSYDVNDAYEEGQEYEAEYNDVRQPQGQADDDYNDDGDEYEVDYSAQGGGGGEAGEEYEADYNDAGHYDDDHDDHQGGAAVDGGVAVGAVQKEWRNDGNSHVYDDNEDNYDDHHDDDVGYDDDEYEDNTAADHGQDDIDRSGHSDDGGVGAAAAALATHAAHVSATSLGSGYGDTMEDERHQQAQAPAHDDDPYEDSLAASSRGPERTPEGLADPNALEADGGELLRIQKEKNAQAMAEMEEEEEVFQPAYDDDEKGREEERNNGGSGAGGVVVMSPKTEASVQSLQYDDHDDDLDDEKHELAEKGEAHGTYEDDYNIADDESFGATKKKRGKCHGKMCGPCPLLFCVQCLGCLLLVAGIVVMIVLGVTGSTFDHTISEVQEALGLTDDETKAPTLRPVAPTTMAPTSAPVITDAPTANPTPVPTSTPTAGPTTTPPVEIATGGPERVYTAPNCTKKKALYYLDLHAWGGDEANEGAVANTISGTFIIRGAGQKAPLLYEAEVLNGKFGSAEGPWMCLDNRKCHNVEVGLVDEATEAGQGEVGWALRPAKETHEATEGGAVATDDATTATVRAAEPDADERPVASGLIPPAGAAGGDGACGFASPPLTARFAKQCPTTCNEGEYSNTEKYGPIPAFPSGNGGGNGGGNGKKNDRDKPARGRLFTKNGGCKNGMLLHELVFVGGKDLASASPSGLAVTIAQANGELVRVPFDDKNLNPNKSKERVNDDTQYLCLRRNRCYSAEIVPEDEGASVPVVAKRSDLEGAAGWEVRRVLTGNTKKKAGKYGKTLASGSLFGTLEEGSFGNGGGSALEGCDFALQPKKGTAAMPQCEKTTCGLPVADNIFDSSIAN